MCGEANNFIIFQSQNPMSSPSPRSSSASSSPPLPFSPPFFSPTPRTNKTMEEVWRDLNIGSPYDNTTREYLPFHGTTPTLRTPDNRNFVFQDFLSKPFGKDTPVTPSNTVPTNGGATLFGSPLEPPTTMLSLNSGGLELCDNSVPVVPNSHTQSNPIQNVSPFEALASSSRLPAMRRRRRKTEVNPADSRHKRMIKNRESAARSRARKQAYTSELELEVSNLLEENERLKEEQKKMCLAAAALLPMKRTLQRTSTAPF